MSQFLKKDLKDEQIEGLKEHLNIENMRRNKSLNYEELLLSKRRNDPSLSFSFIGKGEVG